MKGLAGIVLITHHVQAVVVDLVRHAQQIAQLVQGFLYFRGNAGYPARAARGGGEQGGGLLANDFKVFLTRHAQVVQPAGLRHFPLADVPDGLRKLAAEFCAQHHGVGEENVPQQHGQAVAPQGVSRGFVPALVGLVNHVVMHQRGQMHHFQQRAQADVLRLDSSRGPAHQQRQRGPQHLAL